MCYGLSIWLPVSAQHHHRALIATKTASGKLAKTAAPDDPDDSSSADALPQTLVRIPTEHAPALQAQADAAEAAAEEEAAAANASS